MHLSHLAPNLVNIFVSDDDLKLFLNSYGNYSIILFITLIREWFFPQPRFFERFEDEEEPSRPQGFVSLDVEQLEQMHGLEVYAANKVIIDTVPLLPI